MNWCPEAKKHDTSNSLPSVYGPRVQLKLLEVAWEAHPALLLAVEEASELARLGERNKLALGHHS